MRTSDIYLRPIESSQGIAAARRERSRRFGWPTYRGVSISTHIYSSPRQRNRLT